MGNRFSYADLGFGLGLRAGHYELVLEERPKNVDWFEIISENFIEAHQGYWDFLADVRADYPLVMHGVSLSIGSTDPLNNDYLKKLKALADFLETPWLSDHLCWTGVQGKNTHDLLPVLYTEEALAHIVGRIKQVQDALGRRIVLENPSTYVEFAQSSIPEWEFLARMAEDADCGLLLDVNNVYVSAFNHGYDAKTYIDAIPADRIVQIHLAGHQNFGTHIIDTHDGQVIDAVWELYRYTIATKGNISTMVEWDDHIPEFSVLLAELDKAREAANAKEGSMSFAPLLAKFHSAVLEKNAAAVAADIKRNPRLAPEKQLAIYIDGYRIRLTGAIRSDYPALLALLGENAFDALAHGYIENNPPQHFSLDRYPHGFAAFVRARAQDDFAGELATLECAIAEVFMMEESAPLDPSALDFTPENFGATTLKLRAAAKLLAFSFPVNDWLDAQRGGDVGERPAAEKTYLYVYRHGNNVQRTPLGHAAYVLLEQLGSGLPVAPALAQMEKNYPGHSEMISANLQTWFCQWMANGFFRQGENP